MTTTRPAPTRRSAARRALAVLGLLVALAGALVACGPPPPRLDIAGVTVDEAVGAAVVPVTLSATTTKPVTFRYTTVDVGDARFPADFAYASGTVTIPAGARQASLRIPVVADGLDEADLEHFVVRLSNVAGATAGTTDGRVTILDLDSMPVLFLSAPVYAESDMVGGTQTKDFTVSLSKVSGRPVTARFDTRAAPPAGGQATAPADYTAVSRSVTIEPGQTSVRIPVQAFDDALDEGKVVPAGDVDYETFEGVLSSVTNADVGVGVLSAIILDNDAPPTVAVFDANAVAEGGSLTFGIGLSAPSGRDVSVAWATEDVTAQQPGDYTAAGGTIRFPFGRTIDSVTIPVLEDDCREGREQFDVVVRSVANAGVLDGRGTGPILSDRDDLLC